MTNEETNARAEVVGEVPAREVRGGRGAELVAVAHLEELHVLLDELGELDGVAALAGHGHEQVVREGEGLVRVLLHHQDGAGVRAVGGHHDEVLEAHADRALHGRGNGGCRCITNAKIDRILGFNLSCDDDFQAVFVFANKCKLCEAQA